MDAAAAIAQLVAEKLIECKVAFDELNRVLSRLQQTVASIEKLLHDRAKEQRLGGNIQDTLVRQLSELSEILDDVVATKAKGKRGAASLFCGSCVGRGAAGFLEALAEKDAQLRDTLRVADSEVLVVAASAAEEMAGGAAGRHILHKGARAFWRSQYRNDLELSVSKFWSGIISNSSQMQLLYGKQQEDIRRCLLGRMDVDLDGVITVAEFQRYIDSVTRVLPADVDMMNILRHAVYDEDLRGAMVHGHTAPIVAMDSFNQYVATCDADGYLRLWTATPTTFSLLLVSTLCRRGEVISRVRFRVFGERVSVLAGVAGRIVEVDVFSGERVAVISGGHESPVTSISWENEFVFSTAAFPSTFVHLWRASSNASSELAPGSTIARNNYAKYGILGEGISVIDYVEPLGDGRHVCALSVYHFVAVYDYLATVQIRQLDVLTTRVNYIRCNPAGAVLVGYQDSAEEDVFENPLTSSARSRTRTTLLVGTHFRDPETFISDGVAVDIRSGGGAVQLVDRERSRRWDWMPPPALTPTRVHCNDRDAYVAALHGSTPILLRFQLSRCEEDAPGAKDASATPPPQMIGSNGRWTGSETFSDTTFFTQFESRHAVAFIANPDDPAREVACVSAAASNRLTVLDVDLNCMMRLSMRYAVPRIRCPVTCICYDPQTRSIYIGSLNGKLRRSTLREAEEFHPTVVGDEQGKVEKSAFAFAIDFFKEKTSGGTGRELQGSGRDSQQQQEQGHDPGPEQAKSLCASTSRSPSLNDEEDVLEGGSNGSCLGPSPTMAAFAKYANETATVVGKATETPCMRAVETEIEHFIREALSYAEMESGREMRDHLANSISQLSFAAHRCALQLSAFLATLPLEFTEAERTELCAKIKATRAIVPELAQDANLDTTKTFTQFMQTVCDPGPYMSEPRAATRLFNGSLLCSGCRCRLSDKELWVQLCRACARRREHKGRCFLCQLAPCNPGHVTCDGCYRARRRETELCVCSMAVLGSDLLVGGAPASAPALYEGNGLLVMMDAESLEVKSKLHSYVQGVNNICSTALEGGLFAAAMSQTAVGLLAPTWALTPNNQLRQSIIGTIATDAPATSLLFYTRTVPTTGSAEPASLQLLSFTVQGTVMIHSIVRHGVAAAVLALPLATVNAGIGPGSCIATNGTLIACGSQGGEIAVFRLEDQHNGAGEATAMPGGARNASRKPHAPLISPITTVRSHARQQITAMHFVSDALFTAGSDRCIFKHPLSLFVRAKKKGAKVELIFNFLEGDAFYVGPRRKRGVIDGDWEWRLLRSSQDDQLRMVDALGADEDSWQTVVHANNLVEALVQQREKGRDAAISLRWRSVCCRATLLLLKGPGLDLQLRFEGIKVAQVMRPVKISISVPSAPNAHATAGSTEQSLEFITIPWGEAKTVCFPTLARELSAEDRTVTGASLMLKPVAASHRTAVTVMGGCAPSEGDERGILARNVIIHPQGRSYLSLDLEKLRACVDSEGSITILAHRDASSEAEVVTAGENADVAECSQAELKATATGEGDGDGEREQSKAPRVDIEAGAPRVESQSTSSGSVGERGFLCFTMLHAHEEVKKSHTPHLFLHCN